MFATAGDVSVLVRAVAEREQRHRQLEEDLAVLNGARRPSTADADRIEKVLRAKLKEWHKTLLSQTPLSRQLLRS